MDFGASRLFLKFALKELALKNTSAHRGCFAQNAHIHLPSDPHIIFHDELVTKPSVRRSTTRSSPDRDPSFRGYFILDSEQVQT